MDIRLVMCQYTAGGASLEHAYCSEGQPLGSTLVYCTHAATDAWAGCHCGSWALAGFMRRRERLRWLVLAYMNACGMKANETHRRFTVAVLPLVSAVAKVAGFVYRAGHWEP